MIWGAPNFCPKKDLIHCVLHDKSIGFSVEIEMFSKQKQKRSSLKLRWFFCPNQGVLQKKIKKKRSSLELRWIQIVLLLSKNKRNKEERRFGWEC